MHTIFQVIKIATLSFCDSKTMTKNTIQRKQEMYDNDSCPTCGGDLSSDFHIEKIAKNDKEIEKYTKELNSLNNKKTELLNKEKELKAKRTILIEKKHSTNTNIQHYKRELDDIENSDFFRLKFR